ncbi:MAG: glycosyltransferase family 39 protein, partial [Paludibacteraceae bacterium]|nr:glycosyltransferase family 39 protein [Paludibacteraceae bacterium]
MSNPTATIWQSSVSPMWQQGDIRGNIGQTKPILTKKVTDYALALYLMTIVLVTLMYSSYSLPWYYMLSGVGAVVCVFTYGKKLTDRFSVYRVPKENVFEKKLFYIALGLRIAWMALIYAIFAQSYGDAFGFENGDAKFYHDLGEFVAGMINRGEFNFYDRISKWSGNDDIADMGYGIYVGFIYFLTGHSGTGGPQSFVSTDAGTHIVSIMIVRLIKCFLSAYTVLLVYRLAKRTFGEQVGRLSAIFCALWPNFWYYCGSHLKETEMVFLCVLFIEQADQMLRSRKFTTWKVAPVLLVGVLIFTMRTVLAFVALLSLIFSVVMSSSRVVDWGKRIAV